MLETQGASNVWANILALITSVKAARAGERRLELHHP